MISERVKNIAVSPTMKIAAKAITMRAEGIDVVDFSVGEPDFPTPGFIKEAAKKAIDENKTKYTINSGILPLRQAIAKKLLEENEVEYDPSQIIVSTGAKQNLYNVLMSVVNDGDEVIIPAPYWVSYPEMVKLAGGRPVIVPVKEENGFRLTAEELKNALSSNTKAIILCNPSNPTGAAYNKEQLMELADIIEEENMLVIADEIYEKLVFDDFTFVSFASLSEKIKQRTLIINGVSKAFAMTGWRIGYAAGPADIISSCNKIQSHSTSNPSTVSQYAALSALTGPQYEISRMVSEFQKRRNYLMHRLQSIPGISCHKPEGAFYTFPNVSSYFGKEYKGNYIRNSYGLAYYLLREAKVALIPGAAFGADHFIRISYSTSMENIEKGIDRIGEALSKLKTPAEVKSVKLNNYHSKVTTALKVDSKVTMEQREALVAEAEAQLQYDRYHEWNANINGVVVQLRTNNAHLYDFWVENWYPAQLEADLEPHAVIYAVDEAVGREPYGFYHAETHTAVLFNNDQYASLRSLALGVVSDVGQRLFEVHGIRAMSADYNGCGFLLMGPKGTHKTELFFELLNDESVALHSNDMVFVRYGGGIAAADNPERKLYMPTHTVLLNHQLAPLFDRSKCENVVTSKEDCQNMKCESEEQCDLERGQPYCYFASKKSAAMLDPYWIGGMQKHVKRIDVRAVFILKSDPVTADIEKIPGEEALPVLEAGFSSGPFSESSSDNQPFYNPHLLSKNSQGLEMQKRDFKRLFQIAACYQLNTARLSVQSLAEKIKEVLGQIS